MSTVGWTWRGWCFSTNVAAPRPHSFERFQWPGALLSFLLRLASSTAATTSASYHSSTAPIKIRYSILQHDYVKAGGVVFGIILINLIRFHSTGKLLMSVDAWRCVQVEGRSQSHDVVGSLVIGRFNGRRIWISPVQMDRNGRNRQVGHLDASNTFLFSSTR